MTFGFMMERRDFIQKASLLSGVFLLPQQNFAQNPDRAVQKPSPLTKGETLGLVTPSSAISRNAFQRAIDNISMLGFKVKYTENMRVRKGFLAGTDQQRVDDLHRMFEDSSVSGIVCARGGYGAGRILPMLDYDLIKENPKVFVGYSDITALHYAIHKFTGLITFHGPVGASKFTDLTLDSFTDTLIKSKKRNGFGVKDMGKKENLHQLIVSGATEGLLVGGNLTLMTSLLGTPYDIDFTGKIVFIEEVGESPYRIDRMLTQLRNSGKLKSAKGIALGVFSDCETKPSDPDYADSLSLLEVLQDRLADLPIPVAYGLPFGHVDDNATIPFGLRANFNADEGQITFLEQATI